MQRQVFIEKSGYGGGAEPHPSLSVTDGRLLRAELVAEALDADFLRAVAGSVPLLMEASVEG